MEFQIVPCLPDAHAAAVREIFNDAIANTTALYDYRPRSPETVLQWFGAKARDGYPVLAAVDGAGTLLGFASYGTFRAWPAYKYSVEHSLYVHRDHRRAGVGRALLAAVVDHATGRGYRTVIGGIDADNAASIALHEAQGFVHAGTLRDAGYKFGRWLNLAFYQKLLPGPERPTEGQE
ncbi:MAG TPA: GNAT family N-acetyltransferase [Steroidobacteraceae bacterium]|nr:GNAT family N-acetyltransferase [Steroidobacteraceae bacterium]